MRPRQLWSRLCWGWCCVPCCSWGFLKGSTQRVIKSWSSRYTFRGTTKRRPRGGNFKKIHIEMLGSLIETSITFPAVILKLWYQSHREMLQLGGSQHWSEVLQALTNQSSMDGAALLEYYAPLNDWLVKETGEVSQTVPIVVGAVLGAVALTALIVYFVKEYKNKKKSPPELPPAGEVVKQDDD